MKKMLTQEEWILRAKEVHGDLYAYDKAQYCGWAKKLEILCIACDSYFLQTPATHICDRGGCPTCAVKRRMAVRNQSFDGFLLAAREKHGDRFLYLPANFLGKDSKIEIECSVCNSKFQTTAAKHLATKFGGCKKCWAMAQSGTKTTPFNEFLLIAKKIHGDRYEYNESTYKGFNNEMGLVCNKCGLNFLKRPISHIHQQAGCPACGKEAKIAAIKSNNKRTKTLDEFILQATITHIGRYDYSKVNYVNNRTRVIIMCKKHGGFEQLPKAHIFQKQGCPKCTDKISDPEQLWLDHIGIPDDAQHRQVKIKINSLDREFKNVNFVVDGYVAKELTVYEFLGDFWHGNPKKFPADKINSKTHSAFGALYKKTEKKLAALKRAGFNVVMIWESEWNKLRKSMEG